MTDSHRFARSAQHSLQNLTIQTSVYITETIAKPGFQRLRICILKRTTIRVELGVPLSKQQA